jgi:DMSO/TMAO reductase YedYZ molybdopterin-dependent catalytic subunit
MNSPIDIRRRRILLSGAGAGAASAFSGFSPLAFSAEQAKPLPAYVDWKAADALIVHSSNTIETKRGALGTSVITSDDRLFVRNNVSPPDASIVADRNAWTLAVEGVRKPRTFTVGELRRLGLVTVASVLQCSGNGRGFFAHKASGTQWTVGAAGCVIWSGVPVAAIVQALGGPAEGARFMTGTGGENIPQGIDPKTVMVERSVPLEMMNEALLAWEMNGSPLSLAHGGPLRLVVPGYYGVNNVKYIKRLAFTANESDAAIQASGYRVRPIGQKGNPSQPSMWKMNVKSWINGPAGTDEPVRSGIVQVTGVAFSGGEPVKQVEVSADGGATWKPARLIGPDLGRYAWREFVLPVELKAGTHVLASRATDAAGNTQPEQRVENERAYGHNGWRDAALKVTVA